MGSKPKKPKPTVEEKTSAAYALGEYKYTKDKFAPMLKLLKDEALALDADTSAQRIANADVMQATTAGGPNMQMATDVTKDQNIGTALSSQLVAANNQAGLIKNAAQTSVLGAASGEAMDATTGMAKVGAIANTEALAKAKADSHVALAKNAAAAQIVTAAGFQGMENINSGGSFFSGMNQTPGAGPNAKFTAPKHQPFGGRLSTVG